MTQPEPSENFAATGDCEIVAIHVRVSHYSRFHWQAVCVRGVAAHARESRGIAGSHTTPAGRGSTKFMTAREKSEFDE